MNHDVEQVLTRFWAGTATAAERQWLAEHLDTPALALQARLGREFSEPLDPTRPELALADAQAERVLARLRRQLAVVPSKPRTWLNWRRWAAAAGVALAVMAGANHYAGPDVSRPLQSAVHQSLPPNPLTTQENPGADSLRLALADGSAVTLQAHSRISYAAPFGAGGRTLHLQGAALFAVAKDARHPFTVEAGGFTTTALGTKFWVRAAADHRVTVRLLEGKVVVRATAASHLTMRAQYLIPGRELTVNTQTRQVRVYAFGPAPAPNRSLVAVVPTGLTFEKDALPTVLAQVGERYHVRIGYAPAAVRGLTFTGAFGAADPLPVVLRAICTPNNLSFTKTAGRVSIRKLP